MGPVSLLTSVQNSVPRLTYFGLAASMAVFLTSHTRGWPFPSLTSEPWVYQLNATNPLLRYTLLVVFFAGVAGLCWSWVRLWMLARRDEGISTRTLTKIGLLWSAPLLLAVPLFSGDVYVYFVDGEALARGYDPYEAGVSSMGPTPIIHMVHFLWRTTTTMYGPVFLAMAEGVANLTGGRLIPGVFIFKLIAAASVAAMGWASIRLARYFGRSPAPAFVFVVLNPLTLLHLVGGAHNDATMIGLLFVALAIGLTTKSWPLRAVAIALCMVAASFKVPAFAGVFILGWIWAGPSAGYIKRLIGAGLAGALGLVIFHFLGVVAGGGWGWLAAADVPGQAYPLMAPPNAVAMFLGGPFGAGDSVASVTRAIGTLIAVLAAVGQILRTGRNGTDEEVIRAFGWAMLIIGWLSPAVYPWYLTWGVALLGLTGAGRLNKPLITAVVVCSFLVAPGGYGFLDMWADWRRTVTASLATGIFCWALWKVRPPRGEVSSWTKRGKATQWNQ